MDTFCIKFQENLADWVSIIVDLLIGCGVAWVLAYVVPKKLNDDRSLKDFFIQELQSIKNEYNDFCKDICLDNQSANTIKEVFKQLSLKLNEIQNVANRNLQVDINIMDELNQTKIHVTGCPEINDQYSSLNIKFSAETKNRIWQLQDVFNKNIISAIASVNKAKSK